MKKKKKKEKRRRWENKDFMFHNIYIQQKRWDLIISLVNLFLPKINLKFEQLIKNKLSTKTHKPTCKT